MKRIDSSGSINGKWADKNPATGAPGTTLQADWLNQVQEEICTVIENAAGGAIRIDPASQSQLLDAILKIVSKRKKPPTIIPLAQGFLAYPQVKTAVEMQLILQNDSSLVTAAAKVQLEENFKSTSALTRSWTWIFDDNAIVDVPLPQTARLLGFQWEAGADRLTVDVFGLGNALFVKFNQDQSTPVELQKSSLGQCFFGRITKGSIQGTSTLLANRYCLLMRQIEAGTDIEPDTISCEFTYFT